ncbi:PilZ domain-containing protein [Acidithiobacillus sp. AMEEHan]|uniref:PilZ domain-containing protein n=1 Tax=Acidithiobacillus sp. AMEEHan TaxID=2994951 RepID=UPI0027E56192|nr:PilZ domain-containing protein [Acidithiobacillus sp. AMEEHan]
MSHRDFLDLRSILPARSGLELGIYHQLLINDFPAGSFRDPGDLCAEKGSSSIIFSADEGDNGSLFLFAGCQSEKLLFLARENVLQKIFDHSLICIDSKGFLSSFFTEFSGIQQESRGFLFEQPKLVNWRKKRFLNRLRVDSDVVVLRRSGKPLRGRLHDLSAGGAGFLLGDNDLTVGEMVLLELRISMYPLFVSTALVLRKEIQLNQHFDFFVATRFLLTRPQRQQLQNMLQTLSGDPEFFSGTGTSTPEPDSSPPSTGEESSMSDPEEKSDVVEDTAAAPASKAQPLTAILSLALPYQPNFPTTTPVKEESAEEHVPSAGVEGNLPDPCDAEPSVEKEPEAVETDCDNDMESSDVSTEAVPAFDPVPTQETQSREDEPSEPDLAPLASTPFALTLETPSWRAPIDTISSPETPMTEETLPAKSESEPRSPKIAALRTDQQRWSTRLDLAELRCSQAEVLAEMDRHAQALEQFQEALQMLDQLPSSDGNLPRLLDLRARCQLGRATSLHAMGDASAPSAAAQAIALLDPIWRDGKSRRPQLGRELAQAYMIRGTAQNGWSAAEAVADYQRAQEILDDLRERLGQQSETPDVLHLRARLALCLGRVYGLEGQYDDSLHALDRAQELSRAAVQNLPEAVRWSPETTDASAVLQKAHVFFQLGREAEAETLTEQGLAIWSTIQQRLGEQFTASHWSQLASGHLQAAEQLADLGRLTQARQALDRAQEIFKRLSDELGSSLQPAMQQRIAALHLQDGETALNLGDAPEAMNRAQLAISMLRSLEDRLGQAFPLEMRNLLGSALLFLGKTHSAVGDHRAALEAMNQAQEVLAA